MPAEKQPVPAPEVGTSRGDEGENLLALFAKQRGEPLEEVPVEEPVEQPETGDEPAGDAEAEEVADETTPDEEVPAEPEVYEVKVDGVVEKKTLDELKAGYSAIQAATKRFEAAAEMKRAAEAAQTEVARDRDRYVEGLKQVEALLTQNRDEPDWEKLAEELEPTDYNRQRAQWDNRQRQLHALRTKREAEESKSKAERDTQFEAYLRAEQAKLLEAVPEFKDPAKARTEQADLLARAVQHYGHLGISEAALLAIDSAAPIVILRDAIAYRKLMEAKPKVKPQAVAAPTAKPGVKTVTSKKTPVSEAYGRWKSTGSSADAQDYLIQKIIADEERSRR